MPESLAQASTERGAGFLYGKSCGCAHHREASSRTWGQVCGTIDEGVVQLQSSHIQASGCSYRLQGQQGMQGTRYWSVAVLSPHQQSKCIRVPPTKHQTAQIPLRHSKLEPTTQSVGGIQPMELASRAVLQGEKNSRSTCPPGWWCTWWSPQRRPQERRLCYHRRGSQ